MDRDPKATSRKRRLMLGAGLSLIAASLILIFPYAADVASLYLRPGPERLPPSATVVPATATTTPVPPTATDTPAAATVVADTPTATPRATATPTPTPTPGPFLYPTESYPTRMSIPAIKLDAPVEGVGPTMTRIGGQSVLTWDSPNRYAVGWHLSSVPLGYPGNTVFNGHNNIHGAVFRRLYELSEGDEITLTTAGGDVHTYKVSETALFREAGLALGDRIRNSEWLTSTDDERITLITCWPPTGNSHRFIVVALPYSPDATPTPRHE